ncbi:MAG: site-specific DNA-methyltransferase, partial [Clostridiaceae bacterium]|nr:site-specific DNA-methyltransferase [Clostridiaceae bacterium]
VYDACMGMDGLLLERLINNETLKSHFFVEVNGTLVFDKMKFAWVLESREFLPDSYTMFKNKIGLENSEGKLISQQSDVTLVWPYKDCVLEGGQTKEDQKRNEIFYNETLAPDEVNRLLYPKVFTNAKRYSKNGIEEITEIEDTDNLIIKGNNLLALASLLKRYEGRVKCIYIDPPYYFQKRTDTDTFLYNFNFHFSTWLGFMKDRLRIAKKLLSKAGVIFISIGEDGMHYLKVLADGIFGAEHFVGTVPRRTRHGKSDVPFNFSQDFDWLLVYTNVEDSEKVMGRQVERTYYESDDYPGQPWRLADLTSQRTAKERPNSYFTMVDPRTGKEYPASKKRTWALTKDTFDYYYKKGAIVFPDDYDFLNISKPYARKFKTDDDASGKLSAVISDFQIIDFLKVLFSAAKNMDGNAEIDELLGRDEFDFAKPENLIKAILEVTTVEGDIVLDFLGGSGTTAAVSHKMGRQYILCEQMDYIENVTVERLRKVIDGEQGGVSQEVNWQGGGSFVYCELMEQNETIASALQVADTSEAVQAILNRVTDDGLIIPSVLPDDLRSHMDEFAEMPLEQQKRLVMELIDKNKLYVNLCDMDDEELADSDADKAFTRSFYRMDEKG